MKFAGINREISMWWNEMPTQSDALRAKLAWLPRWPAMASQEIRVMEAKESYHNYGSLIPLLSTLKAIY
jgi:hypothetical protein